MDRQKRGYVGAADLMAELQRDRKWVAQNAEGEAKRAAAEMRFRVEEEPMIADLAKVGFEVNSVWDLVNTNAVYAAAIPVLLDHLRRPYHDRIRNGVIRALTTREARGLAGPAILSELQNERGAENRWALANALTVVADEKDTDGIEALLREPAYEDVSERLSEALNGIKNGA